MKIKALLGGAVALLLAGCAGHHHGNMPRTPPSTRPQVTIVDGRYITVSPEPLVFTKSQGSVRIVWHLPRNSDYSFPDNGIVVDGVVTKRQSQDNRDGTRTDTTLLDGKQNEIIDCKPSADRKEFSCLNKNSKTALYKYTIRVLKGDKPLAPLDPYLWNDE
jgi:hypothetical protein